MTQRSHGLALAAAVVGVFLTACGTTTPVASRQSPSASSSTAPAESPSPSSAPKASPTPTSDPRLVIWDPSNEVRLARLDARDTATVKGDFQQIAGGQVIVLNGTTLVALNRNGTTKTLGHLTGSPSAVVVKPDLTQWLYMTWDAGQIYRLHLGSAGHDGIITTNPAPTQEQIFRPYTWNATGVYVTKEPTGLGGAGPFLEYHFPLARLDLVSGKVTDVSPACVAYAVLDDGTMVCGNRAAGAIEVRRPSGTSNSINLGTDANTFIRVAVSPDGRRVIIGRNGAKNPVINYQMAVADLAAPSAAAFGPLDYLPDSWLPDGRIVATHQCVISDWGGGPCSGGLDGTYFFSADGKSHSLFFKLAGNARVVGSI